MAFNLRVKPLRIKSTLITQEDLEKRCNCSELRILNNKLVPICKSEHGPACTAYIDDVLGFPLCSCVKYGQVLFRKKPNFYLDNMNTCEYKPRKEIKN